jgi:hypothetical protein
MPLGKSPLRLFGRRSGVLARSNDAQVWACPEPSGAAVVVVGRRR